MEVDAASLVEIAAALGIPHVCLFVQGLPGRTDFPVIKPEDMPRIKAAMRDTGVSAYNLEAFVLTPDVDISSFRPALERGRELGGIRATAFDSDDDEARIIDHFAAFCELAVEMGIKPGLEFMPLRTIKTLEQGLRVVKGANNPEATLAVDTLHLFAGAATPEQLAAIDRHLIGYIQFCDGPMVEPFSQYRDVAMHRRLPPGEGVFPLVDYLRALPHDRPLSMETPINNLRDKGMSPLDRARIVHDATRRFLDQHDQK